MSNNILVKNKEWISFIEETGMKDPEAMQHFKDHLSSHAKLRARLTALAKEQGLKVDCITNENSGTVKGGLVSSILQEFKNVGRSETEKEINEALSAEGFICSELVFN